MEIKKECEQYLTEYYQDLFFGNVNKRYQAMTGVELRKRMSRLTEANLKPLVKSSKLSDIRAMLSGVCAYLMRRGGHLIGPALEQWESGCRQMDEFCEALAGKDLGYVNDLSLKDLEQVLEMQGIHRYLLANSLERAYQLFYIPKAIKKGILESMKQEPEQGYPGARKIKRRFILHASPTNSGRTRDALKRPKECGRGTYFGPLGLLALEAHGRLNAEGLSCSIATSEETLEVPGAVYQPCTAEMLNGHEYSDIVVMGECQMITDPYREHNWTRTVLGLRAEGIHLCMAPEAENIVVQMIKRCGDQYRVVRHKRNTWPTMGEKPYNLKQGLEKGDTLVVFSKKSVLTLAVHLEDEGVHCSVIYGSLPSATGRGQVRRFLVRETEVAVSTDAVDMGLNLPIHRIVFVETRKFGGVNKRTLSPEEIKQIAGQAGRYGLYDEEFMTAIDEPEIVEDDLSGMPMPVMKTYVEFPEQLPNLPAKIDTLAKIQAGMDTPSIYKKMEVDELLALYMSFEHIHRDDMGEYSRQEVYKLITCSINIDNRMVMDLWKDYYRGYRDVTELEFPYSPGEGLYDLESYYKILDLYFQFSRRVGLPVQAENLTEERCSTEEEISRILKTGYASYTRRCSVCGRELLWDHPFSIYERCSERGRISQGHDRLGRRRAAGNGM